jgi:putative nucleotidyltransferase with HDIG domain
MLWSRRRGARRAEIRKNRPDSSTRRWAELRANGTLVSIWVAAGFCLATILVMMLRDSVVQYRPGDYVPSDILARVSFRYPDQDKLADLRQEKRNAEPHVFSTNGDVYRRIEDTLIRLPQQVAKLKPDELPPEYRNRFNSAALTVLTEDAAPPNDEKYAALVKAYMEELRNLDPIVLPDDQRHEELLIDPYRSINIAGMGRVRVDSTYSNKQLDNLDATLKAFAKKDFVYALAPSIAQLSLEAFAANPTHKYDEPATIAAQNAAADKVTPAEAEVIYSPKDTIVSRGPINSKGWDLLRAENNAWLSTDANLWKSRGGTAASVIILTIIVAAYLGKYNPRVVRNHARGVAIGALMLSMLVLAQIAGIGSSPTYVFGIAPTIIVAMILTIAYDQRFAVGVASIHAVLVTIALNQGVSFFLVLWAGVLTCCFLLDEIRTRSKLIEVGGATAIALFIATYAAGFLELVPPMFIFRNALLAAAAGLGVGFVVLGILPFIEKTFKITTSMTLLELADASQPLMRRLAMEAPGTWHHSQQVATLSEEAAEAIGADSLLCRVGSYYHDIGKLMKPDYFVENQTDGVNRHMGITPDLSYRIIIGHVKDGVAMAKEYGLPTKLILFIEQHHGTTLVEYFYHRACNSADTDGPKIAEHEFRYPGPKPKSKEIGIVMLADCVESATRAMTDPSSARIDALVHDLTMKRLLDGQFDECDLTMRDVERIERSLAKTLQGIYHGRIAYPSTKQIPASSTDTTTAAKTA